MYLQLILGFNSKQETKEKDIRKNCADGKDLTFPPAQIKVDCFQIFSVVIMM